jgi:hypothetical protein
MEVTVSEGLIRITRMILTIHPYHSEEEDPDEYPFPLTLRTKRSTGPTSPAGAVITNGS